MKTTKKFKKLSLNYKIIRISQKFIKLVIIFKIIINYKLEDTKNSKWHQKKELQLQLSF
jgi:hypothetical protein